MAYVHGKGTKVYIAGYDLSAYFRSASGKASAEVAETTTFGDTAKDFIAGLKDGTLGLEGVFDGAANAVDARLAAALGANSTVITVFPGGETAIGDAGYGLTAVETAYTIEAPVDGVVAVSAEAQSSAGLERVLSLHVLGAETIAGSGTSVDNAAASSAGGSGYVQVTAFTGTNVTLKVQHSTDNFAADTTDLITFTAATGITAERKTVTGSVKRYIRANWSGTFTSATFSVAFSRG